MKIVLAALLLLGLSACSTHQQENKSSSVRHMIKSEQLREMMRELDMVVYERQKSEIDRDSLRKRYVLTLAQTLRKLSSELSKIKQTKQLSDVQVYEKHASLLQENATDLENLAKSYKFELLPQSLQEVRNTCSSCHKHFGVKH